MTVFGIRAWIIYCSWIIVVINHTLMHSTTRTKHFKACPSAMHTSSPNFFRGVLGRKWKSPRKIFGAPPARKKRGSQIFRLRRAFFVVEALKTAKKPFKTAKNRSIFLKTSIFWKKGPQNFFACGGLFFGKWVGQFYKLGRTKEGG